MGGGEEGLKLANLAAKGLTPHYIVRLCVVTARVPACPIFCFFARLGSKGRSHRLAIQKRRVSLIMSDFTKKYQNYYDREICW